MKLNKITCLILLISAILLNIITLVSLSQQMTKDYFDLFQIIFKYFNNFVLCNIWKKILYLVFLMVGINLLYVSKIFARLQFNFGIQKSCINQPKNGTVQWRHKLETIYIFLTFWSNLFNSPFTPNSNIYLQSSFFIGHFHFPLVTFNLQAI